MNQRLSTEIDTYTKRTSRSAEAHKKNLRHLPLGVASNYRSYDPWPLFVKEAHGSHFRDLDGNDYIDHNLCFGALMAGHGHPAIMSAVSAQLSRGTLYGMPHELEWQLAEKICARFGFEMLRFGNSGTEVTMAALRLARAATGRDKVLKFEGSYHGLHDTALVSVKPHAPDFGEAGRPVSVPGGLGVPRSAVEDVVISAFNDLEGVRSRFEQFPGQIAAIILEPIMMNVGLCMPEPGFLQGLREIATRAGALLIFDEVKTGAKLGMGGATERFAVKPDIVCLAKSIGGGLPLAAFGASRAIMDLIAQRRVFHGGTYNTNPLSMAAGLANFTQVLTRENYELVDRLSAKLEKGYKKAIAKHGIEGYVITAGANGALMFYPREIRNYRDWLGIDEDLWRQYWFGMVNRGVMCQPYWWDEQWTISVQHTEADINKHISAFEDIAEGLAKTQAENRVTQNAGRVKVRA